MIPATHQIVLGSRSPRRLELLTHLVAPGRIAVVPPLNSEEAGFGGLTDMIAIEDRIRAVARAKSADIRPRLAPGWDVVLTADTIVVAAEQDGTPVVLCQPPEDDTWRDVVRSWFHGYYLGRRHRVMSAVCVVTPDGLTLERVVTSHVEFAADAEPYLDWYLATDEPRGKAGGYALQGAASLFVERIEGSLSNIVGLPLRATSELLSAAGVPVAPTHPRREPLS